MTPILRTDAVTRSFALLAACLLATACDGDPVAPGEEGPGLPRRYSLTVIERPAGLQQMELLPRAINASGQVVLGSGYSGRTLVLWSGGSATAFTAPYLATATGLDDSGRIVGCTGSVFGQGEQRPLLGEAGRLWYLAGAGLERACARAVASRGTVVGEAGPAGRERAFVLEAGRVTLLDVPGDSTSQAVAVNAAGHVAVNSQRTVAPLPNEPASVVRASLWRGGALVPLGHLDSPAAGPGQVADPSRFSHIARDLNDRDEVVGDSWGMVCTADRSACGSRMRAFLWRGGRMTDVGRDLPVDASSAVAVNRWGHVLVQGYSGRTPVPFLWHEGRVLNLAEAVAATGWRLTGVHDLNDAGQVVATAQNTATGAFAAVRLDPA
jgi:uncharacterized membrane protein